MQPYHLIKQEIILDWEHLVTYRLVPSKPHIDLLRYRCIKKPLAICCQELRVILCIILCLFSQCHKSTHIPIPSNQGMFSAWCHARQQLSYMICSGFLAWGVDMIFLSSPVSVISYCLQIPQNKWQQDIRDSLSIVECSMTEHDFTRLHNGLLIVCPTSMQVIFGPARHCANCSVIWWSYWEKMSTINNWQDNNMVPVLPTIQWNIICFNPSWVMLIIHLHILFVISAHLKPLNILL